jgi:hypothetical protein
MYDPYWGSEWCLLQIVEYIFHLYLNYTTTKILLNMISGFHRDVD